MHRIEPSDAEAAGAASRSTNSSDTPGTSLDFWKGFWRLADPKITLASMASIFLGTCLAAADGSVHAGWLVVTVIAFFAIEVAKNASGDLYDLETDLAVAEVDRTDFSGGKRVLVDGILTRRQTRAIAAAFYVVGVALGAWIVLRREPLAIWPGAVGLVLAWSYNGPPARLAYRGLGEIDVAICYGPLICISTYLIQAGTVPGHVVFASLPLGVLIAAFLWINEFPDFNADRRTGKKNWIVRLGRRRASRVLPAIYATAFLLLACAPAAGLPRTAWLGALAAIPAAWVSNRAWRAPGSCYRDAPVSAGALMAFLVLAAGMGIGALVA